MKTRYLYVYRLTIQPTLLNRRKKPAHGFQVHLPKYGLTRWFLISTKRGEHASLKAALSFRDRILKHPPTKLQAARYKRRRAAENARERERRGHPV